MIKYSEQELNRYVTKALLSQPLEAKTACLNPASLQRILVQPR